MVKGAIRAAWSSQGWEKSQLQYPLSDELITDGTNKKGRHQLFQGGEIYWTPEKGSKVNHYPVAVTSKACGDLSAGNVTASQIWIKISSNGEWQFHAYLHDSSTWYGDSYAIGFVFENDGHGAVMSGVLGADYSGPATNADRTISGIDPWIQGCWSKVKDMGVRFHLHVSDDPTSAFNSVLNDLKQYGPSLVTLATAVL